MVINFIFIFNLNILLIIIKKKILNFLKIYIYVLLYMMVFLHDYLLFNFSHSSIIRDIYIVLNVRVFNIFKIIVVGCFFGTLSYFLGNLYLFL